LAVARRAPALADRLIAARARKALQNGAIGRSPLAVRARQHFTN
jgi:hypothetical protein